MNTSSTGVNINPLEIKPYVGMTGFYSLKDPYSALVDSNVEYTCIGVSSISAAVAMGKDVKGDIYLYNKDTEANYLRDESLNVSLITLQSSIGTMVTVPSSALNMLPSGEGVLYNSVMLGVSLSVIPTNLNLSAISSQIEDTVFKHLGVKSSVTPVVMGAPISISLEKHTIIENARRVKIAEGINPILENDNLKIQNSKLAAKVGELEGYIKTKIPPPSNTTSSNITSNATSNVTSNVTVNVSSNTTSSNITSNTTTVNVSSNTSS